MHGSLRTRSLAAEKRPTRTPSASPATARAPEAVLAIWHDVAPGRAVEVRDWYAREHHFERLAVPGFLEARRYDRLAGAGADVFNLYALNSPDVLQSDAYLQRLAAPSKWTRTVMPHFRHMSRTPCTVIADAGRGQGGHLAAVAANEGELKDPRQVCDQLMTLPGVLRARALLGSRMKSPETAETALRGGPDARVAWALVVEVDTAEAAQTALYAARDLSRVGNATQQCAVYRLAFCMRNDTIEGALPA
jgi:hypothetical protein